MILKRKSEHITSQSKLKQKQGKHCEKKLKKQPKLHGSASTRSFKLQKNNSSRPTVQVQNQDRDPQNNFNYLNTIINPRQQSNLHKQQSKSKASKNTKLRKSASTGLLKNNQAPRRSLSPFYHKQGNQTKQTKQMRQKNLELKNKYHSKHTSRSEKQFLKESNAKLKNLIKKKEQKKTESKTIKNNNKTHKSKKNHSQHLKTDISSRMPSISRELEKIPKKSNRAVKMKDLVKIGKKSVVKESKTNRHKIKNSIVFSDVSFNDISIRHSKKKVYERLYQDIQANNSLGYIEELTVKIKAAITIQRHYRGYLTRKCIEQLKQMTYCAIKIQSVWRGYKCRKSLNQQPYRKNNGRNFIKKNLSIENSLITIKDFSEEPKQHKNFKFFNFDNQSSYKNQLMNSDRIGTHRDPTENKKYLEILESLLHQEELEEKYKERIRASLKVDIDSHSSSLEKQCKKEVYVKNKINSEIISEKSFNSPRSMCSPKGGISFPSPKSSSKNKSNFVGHSQFLELYSSPKPTIVGQKYNADKIEQGAPIRSIQKKSISKSLTQNDDRFTTEKKQIRPFDTTFEFIEEFELIIVDFLRDNDQMKDLFLSRIKQCESHRTLLVLKQWDKFCEQPGFQESLMPQFAFTQEYYQPIIFDTLMQSQIIEEPAMKIYLEAKNYSQQSWLHNSEQRSAYESYLRLIFDGLTDAIYRNYRSQIITKNTKFYGSNYDGHDLFKFILMNSLTSMQGWCQYSCGMEIPVDQMNPDYPLYCQKNEERMRLFVNSDIKPIIKTQFDSWIFWIVMMIGEIIFQTLAQQLSGLLFKPRNN